MESNQERLVNISYPCILFHVDSNTRLLIIGYCRFENGLLSALLVSVESHFNNRLNVANNIAQQLFGLISKYFNQINVEVSITAKAVFHFYALNITISEFTIRATKITCYRSIVYARIGEQHYSAV